VICLDGAPAPRRSTSARRRASAGASCSSANGWRAWTSPSSLSDNAEGRAAGRPASPRARPPRHRPCDGARRQRADRRPARRDGRGAHPPRPAGAGRMDHPRRLLARIRREAARRILAMDERPTAVFCAADMVAFGLIAGLSGAAGSGCPMTSRSWASTISRCPSTTSPRSPRSGRTATFWAAGGRDADGADRRDAPVAEAGMIPVELVLRGSTGPAPAG
jgi:hypothetical protein